MRKLRVELAEGKNISPSDLTGFADPYCVVTLLGGDNEQHFKSRVVKQSLNPEWNEEFDFKLEDHVQHTLQFELFDKDKFSKDDFIGRAEVAVETLKEGKVYTVWLKLDGGSGEIKVKIHLSDANGLFTNYAVASTPASPNSPPSHSSPFSYSAPPNSGPPPKIANLSPSNQNPNQKITYAIPRNAPQSISYDPAPTPSNAF